MEHSRQTALKDVRDAAKDKQIHDAEAYFKRYYLKFDKLALVFQDMDIQAWI